MGIHRFFSYLNRHPRFRKAIIKRVPDKISSFYVDCNGIFHGAKADVYGKTKSKDKAKLESPSSIFLHIGQYLFQFELYDAIHLSNNQNPLNYQS